jgi:hypothetical protein
LSYSAVRYYPLFDSRKKFPLSQTITSSIKESTNLLSTSRTLYKRNKFGRQRPFRVERKMASIFSFTFF